MPGERDSHGGCNGGLSDTAFSHDHDETTAGLRKPINQLAQSHEPIRHPYFRDIGGERFLGREKIPQRGQIVDVTPMQSDVRTRQ